MRNITKSNGKEYICKYHRKDGNLILPLPRLILNNAKFHITVYPQKGGNRTFKGVI